MNAALFKIPAGRLELTGRVSDIAAQTEIDAHDWKNIIRTGADPGKPDYSRPASRGEGARRLKLDNRRRVLKNRNFQFDWYNGGN